MSEVETAGWHCPGLRPPRGPQKTLLWWRGQRPVPITAGQRLHPVGPQSPPLPPPPSPWPRRWAGGPGQGLPTAPRWGTRGSEHGALPPCPAAIRPAGLCGHEPGSSWAGPRGEAVSLSPAGCLQPPPGSATRARPCGRRRRPGGAGCSVDWLCGLAVPRRLPLQSPGMELQPRPAPARWRCLPAQRLRQDRVGWAAGSGPRSPTGRGGGQGSLHGDRGVRREGRYKEEGGQQGEAWNPQS